MAFSKRSLEPVILLLMTIATVTLFFTKSKHTVHDPKSSNSAAASSTKRTVAGESLFPLCHFDLSSRKLRYGCGHVPEFFLTLAKQGWEKDHLNQVAASKKKCLVTFGEWIGPVAMFWMSTHGPDTHVVAFEPDPIAFSSLYSNLQHYRKYNDILIEHMCVNVDGKPTNIQVHGLSGSRVGTSDATYIVQCISYVDLFKKYKDMDCLYKIDIEGYEEQLIDKVLEYTPSELSFSFHEGYIEKKPEFYKKLKRLKAKFGNCTSGGDMYYCVQ
jgi:FkbM family methyltransferase